MIKFLRSGHLLKMSTCHDATTRALVEFHALSGAGINKFNARKEQEIILGRHLAMPETLSTKRSFTSAQCP